VAAPAPIPVAAAPVAVAGKASLRLNKPEAASASEESAAGAPSCPKHPAEGVVESCRVCGKPMCLKCMEQFGYVCSVFCRNKAEATGVDVPVYKHQRSVVQRKAGAKVRRIGYAVAALLVGLLGAWIWFEFFGSKPRVVYSLQIPKGQRARFYQMISPGQLLSVKKDQMSLFDVKEQKDIWSVPLKWESESGLRRTRLAEEDDDEEDSEIDRAFFPTPKVLSATDDLWLAWPDRIWCVDKATGTRKHEIPIKGSVSMMEKSESAILLITSEDYRHKKLTQIALPAGTVQTSDLNPTPVAQKTNQNTKTAAAKKPATTTKIAPGASNPEVAAANAALAAGEDEEDSDLDFSGGDQYVLAGANVAEFKTKLLEKKTIAHQAMKAKTGPGRLESGKATAGASLELAQELLNDMRRDATGGVVHEDVSRYQVSVRRVPAKDIPDWTGEVIGPPSFHPLKTVDVIGSGKAAVVIDKNNKKLWEAQLTYAMPKRYSWAGDDDEAATSQCAEVGDRLYVADEGMLTAFKTANGEVLWRLNSIGISKIQHDAEGNLYVNTTDMSPDELKYSQEVNIFKKTQSVFMKVDSRTGKVKWKQQYIGDNTFLSGKIIYATKGGVDVLSSLNSEGSSYNYHLYGIKPSSGRVDWDHYEPRLPVRFDAHDNWIMLHFRGELQVLKFISL
jgi:hypothetical protein